MNVAADSQHYFFGRWRKRIHETGERLIPQAGAMGDTPIGSPASSSETTSSGSRTSSERRTHEVTTATAATVLGMSLGGERPKGFRMVDHPFLCAIEDSSTGTILFLGVIHDPKL